MKRQGALYSLSASLQHSISVAAAEACQSVEVRLRFVEYITLPDYGQRVVLRFEPLDKWPESLQEVDALESALRSRLAPDYSATLMGSVYAAIGTPLSDGADALVTIDNTISESVLDDTETTHSASLRHDADAIRESLNLGPTYLVWEIEVPGEETTAKPHILIVNSAEQGYGECSHPPCTEVAFGATSCAVHFLKNNGSFWGCRKAYACAEREGKALGSFILTSAQ
jgi:hypothetical protein